MPPPPRLPLQVVRPPLLQMRPAIVRHIARSLHRRHLETGLLQDEWNEKISKMPELRDDRRTALADLSGGGFFIRRVASPGALAVRAAGKPLPRRFVSPSNNKENVPPVWAVRATPPKKRSPLPDWYLRTPLRDITAIVKALMVTGATSPRANGDRSDFPSGMS